MAQKAGAEDAILVMDVADALERGQIEAGDEASLVARLRARYRGQGIDLSEALAREGISAARENRFAHRPPRKTPRHRLAALYVARRRWGRPLLGAAATLLVAGTLYLFVYQPFETSRVEAARVELAQTLPARIQAVYEAIYTETMVQAALLEAEPWVERGQEAAMRGDREETLAAIEALEAIHQRLVADYTLRIVDREGEQTGIWTIPENRTEATYYYIAVEAVGPDGAVVPLPITDEQTGQTETVQTWAIRVPEITYESVRADRLDDGIIQRNVLGIKRYGFLETDFTMPVLEGTITRW